MFDSFQLGFATIDENKNQKDGDSFFFENAQISRIEGHIVRMQADILSPVEGLK